VNYLIASISLIVLISGCGITPQPKQPKIVAVDEHLEMPQLTQHGVVLDMNAIAFEWNTLTDPEVEGVYIYKASIDDKKDMNLSIPYKVISNRYATHFVDSEIKPAHRYVYKFASYKGDKRSNLSKKIPLRSLSVLPSVTWIYGVSNMPRSAKILWRPHPNPRVKSYIIERKAPNEKHYKSIAEIEGRLHAEYIDWNLKDSAIYLYRIRVKTFDDIVSNISAFVKIKTKKAPTSIQGFHASTNLPKKIILTWQPSTQKDFKRYYLYRSEQKNGDYTLIAKLYNPKFIDKTQEDGEVYYYHLTVIDNDGLESDFVATKGMSLAQPKAPKLVDLKLKDGKIILHWIALDSRAKSYMILRHEKIGWFDEVVKRYEDIKEQEFIDSDIKSGATYTYEVYALDRYLLVSKPSNQLQITTKQNKKAEK